MLRQGNTQVVTLTVVKSRIRPVMKQTVHDPLFGPLLQSTEEMIFQNNVRQSTTFKNRTIGYNHRAWHNYHYVIYSVSRHTRIRFT